MTASHRHPPRPRTPLVCVAALAIPSAAFADCAHEIIDQAYQGKITKTYSQACYNAAIKIEPVDGSSYSDIDSIIKDAKHAAALAAQDSKVVSVPTTTNESPRNQYAHPATTTTRHRDHHRRRRARSRAGSALGGRVDPPSSHAARAGHDGPEDALRAVGDPARRAVGDARARPARPGARGRRPRRRDRARRARRACSCSPVSPARSCAAAPPARTSSRRVANPHRCAVLELRPTPPVTILGVGGSDGTLDLVESPPEGRGRPSALPRPMVLA